MRNLNLLLVCCAALASSVQAQSSGHDALYYGQEQGFFDPEPLAFRSAPPRSYLSTSPQRFVPISQGHEFHNSRLPIATDEKPRVLIRSYDPELGVSIDTEVTDPTCLMSCRSSEAATDR